MGKRAVASPSGMPGSCGTGAREDPGKAGVSAAGVPSLGLTSHSKGSGVQQSPRPPGMPFR